MRKVHSGGNDPGRFDADRPPKKGPLPAHAASHFTLDHQQLGARLDERLAEWRIQATEEDRPAGLKAKNGKPVNDRSFNNILEYVEPPPLPVPPKPAHESLNYRYVKELENVVANYGVAGDAVRTIVQKEVFGSVRDNVSRPPTAPSNWRAPASSGPKQMLAGTPRSRPSTAASTPRPSTAESKKPRPPSRQVATSSSRLMQRSASVDHVGVNRRNASLTPRRTQPQWPRRMAEEQATKLWRPPSEWKLDRFQGSPRVFSEEPAGQPADLRVEPDGRGGRYLVRNES